MNQYTTIFTVGQERLGCLHHEARIAELQPKSRLRRQIARVLKRLAAYLEQEPILQMP